MRIYNDSSFDNQTVSNNQIVPIYTNQNSNFSPGNIFFNSITNNFCGINNSGTAITLNPSTLATIGVGITPTGIAITPDNRYAYVANNNNYGILDSVTVIDLSTNLPIKTITDASLNQGYTVTIYSGNAYVTNSAGSTITIINTSSNTVTGTITGFDGPSGLVINGNIGYVNNYGASGGVESGNGHTISVVNMLTNTIIGTINVNQAPAALALSPNGQYLYCVNYVTGIANNGTINVIQTSNNTITQTINGFFGPFAISITPNGKFAYVTNFGSNNFSPFGTTISVVDLTSYTIVSTINAGIQPSGIAITQSGKYAYVLNYNTLYAGANFTNLTAGQGTINIIDTSSNKIIPPTILVGQSPSNITISPNGKLAYISNFISNTVSVITLLN